MGKVVCLKIYTPLNPLSRGEMFICLTPSVVDDFSQPATFLVSVFASFQKWNKNTGTI